MLRHLHINWVAWYAVAVHLVWGLGLLLSDKVAKITAIAALSYGQYTVALLMIGAALTASLSMTKYDNTRVGLTLLLPQQILLMISAGGAIVASIHGVYPDGYVSTSLFITTDQSPVVLTAVFHTLAILDKYRIHLPWRNGNSE